MSDQHFELRQGTFRVTTDPRLQDLDAVHDLLRVTHWAREMSRATLETAAANSLCFGLFDEQKQIGFARIVTDYCTFAYLTDVIIAEEYRGRGLGRWLTEAVVSHPLLCDLRRIALLTLDAQKLYEQYGFGADAGRLTYMERRAPK